MLKKLIPDFILCWYHWMLAFWAAVTYGWPSKKIKVIGVTGTKGKSTIVVLAGQILEENGRKVGWISSLTINDGKKEVMNPYHMTMPGRFFIQRTLRQIVKNGCEYALVEVTSEGIKQHRHRFINWAGAVFTNLAPEHLEAHGGFENYRQEKEKLFAAAARNKNSFGVYNLDDENAEHFLAFPVKKKIGYFLNPPQPSFKKEGAVPPLKLRGGEGVKTRGSHAPLRGELFELKISNIQLYANGSEFEINGVKFKTNLLGEFNVYNCAAAMAVGLACGADLATAARALGKIKAIPGRLEMIDEEQDFSVIVDLAHTPDSFEKVFKLFNGLKNIVSSPQMRGGLRWGVENRNITSLRLPSPAAQANGGQASPSSIEDGRKKPKIISVFGSAGGGRDKWKRPELGRIASENSDIVIICNEDPYDELPEEICQQIAVGCKKTQPEIILDRRQAIARGLSLAQAGDIVLFLGKGTEQTYVEGKNRIKWDDRDVAREELKKLTSG